MTSVDTDKERTNRKSTLSSDERILAKITDIVLNEHRPFSYHDLKSFEWQGQIFTYSHGHLRNTFSRLSRQGDIELVCRSPQAFFTLPGIKFGKVMTPYSIVDNAVLTRKQREFLRIFKILELNNPAIHDIRLRFTCEGLREIILKSNSDLIDNIDQQSNKNITIKKITYDDITLTIVIHNTNTVSIEIKCSSNPIPVDLIGLSKLTSLLTRAEVSLQGIINDYYGNNPNNSITKIDNIPITIPNHMNWVVTMWHFGYDSESILTGEHFQITWKESLETFRIYSKKRRT